MWGWALEINSFDQVSDAVMIEPNSIPIQMSTSTHTKPCMLCACLSPSLKQW